MSPPLDMNGPLLINQLSLALTTSAVIMVHMLFRQLSIIVLPPTSAVQLLAISRILSFLMLLLVVTTQQLLLCFLHLLPSPPGEALYSRLGNNTAGLLNVVLVPHALRVAHYLCIRIQHCPS